MRRRSSATPRCFVAAEDAFVALALVRFGIPFGVIRKIFVDGNSRVGEPDCRSESPLLIAERRCNEPSRRAAHGIDASLEMAQ